MIHVVITSLDLQQHVQLTNRVKQLGGSVVEICEDRILREKLKQQHIVQLNCHHLTSNSTHT